MPAEDSRASESAVNVLKTLPKDSGTYVLYAIFCLQTEEMGNSSDCLDEETNLQSKWDINRCAVCVPWRNGGVAGGANAAVLVRGLKLTWSVRRQRRRVWSRKKGTFEF